MSPLLLDTQIALWWLADDRRLTPALRDSLSAARSVHVSSASTWEVAIKIAIGRLRLDLAPSASFASVCAQQGFELVPVSHEDAWAVLDLPAGRADPFDRLIAATARRRGWTVVTADRGFEELNVATLWP